MNMNGTMLACYAALSLSMGASVQGAPNAAQNAKTVCENVAFNFHECAAQVREAAQTAASLEDLLEVSSYWSTRYDARVERLRSGPVGLVKAKSDVQLIRETLIGEVEDEAKSKIAEGIAKKVIPAEWQQAWDKFWSKYLKGISAFTNHPAAKGVVATLRASMPSQIATDYDELELSNNGVGKAVSERMSVLIPTPSMAQTIMDAAYRMANEKLGPQLQVAPEIKKH